METRTQKRFPVTPHDSSFSPLLLLPPFLFTSEKIVCLLTASPALSSDLLTLEVDPPLCSPRRRLRLHPRLDLARHRHERVLDVDCGLGRSLEELNLEGVGKLLALLGGHHALGGGEVDLVADEELVNILTGVAVDLRRAERGGKGGLRARSWV